MNTNQACERCGASVEATPGLQGLCAACLLKASLQPEVVVTGGSARRPAPTLDALAPHFPDLEFLGLIGQGGMGAVYRVRQRSLGREAALKVLSLDTEVDPAFGERFEREARLLASIEHPNIVSVYGAGKAGPHWYLLMELVDGVSLRQVIAARETDPRAALAIVGQVCDALQAAHDRGVVHRDIKPENVIVTRKGQAKILDFGLAKLMHREPRTANTLTETGQVMGTVRYMAPEQWERPLSVDHRADIYSLGVVLYELLTGELPMGRFPLPSQKAAVGASVDKIVLKTLEKEPAQRYQRASEVRADVTRAAGATSAGAASDAAATKSRSTLRTLVGLGAAASGMACVALIAIFFFYVAVGDQFVGVRGLFLCGLLAVPLGSVALGLWIYLGRPWPRARWAQAALVLLPPCLFACSFAIGNVLHRGRARLVQHASQGQSLRFQAEALEQEYPWCPEARLAVFSDDPNTELDERLLIHINERLIESLVDLHSEGFVPLSLSVVEQEERNASLDLARISALLHYALLDSAQLENIVRNGSQSTSFEIPAMTTALARNELVLRALLASRRDGNIITTDSNGTRSFVSPDFTWLGIRGAEAQTLVSIDTATLEARCKSVARPEGLEADRRRLDELFGLDELLEYAAQRTHVEIRNPNSATPSGRMTHADGRTRELSTADLRGRYAILLYLARGK